MSMETFDVGGRQLTEFQLYQLYLRWLQATGQTNSPSQEDFNMTWKAEQIPPQYHTQAGVLTGPAYRPSQVSPDIKDLSEKINTLLDVIKAQESTKNAEATSDSDNESTASIISQIAMANEKKDHKILKNYVLPILFGFIAALGFGITIGSMTSIDDKSPIEYTFAMFDKWGEWLNISDGYHVNIEDDKGE